MLYALPDHEVMEYLLPAIQEQQLSVDEAIERLRCNPGLVPVAINPQQLAAVYFADIGDSPLQEWKYIYTIERLSREGMIGEMFSTDLAILEREDLISDGMVPQGLIFHVSRCGSTLLTKSLARSAQNLCINQGGPLQEGFWAAITDHWQHQPVIDTRNIRMLRNIVMLMARRRRADYRRCFIKFISWNVIYLDYIRAAFPDVPTLYLYREPREVIATVMQETTAVLRAKGKPQAAMLTGLAPAESKLMSDIEYLAHCYAHYFNIVLDTSTDSANLHLLNYNSLNHQESYAEILERGFNLKPEAMELEQMRQQYRYYSKDDTDKTIFAVDSETLLDKFSSSDVELIDRICSEGVIRLNQSSNNLFPAD